MIIGYLTNIYPVHSHSFIRREIAAVEALGHDVRRYTIRSGGELKDPADVAEQRRTAVVLDAGALALDQGVDGDRRAVNELIDLARIEPALANAIDHAAGQLGNLLQYALIRLRPMLFPILLHILYLAR